MSPKELKLQIAVEALKLGLIDWFQYFELCRKVEGDE